MKRTLLAAVVAGMAWTGSTVSAATYGFQGTGNWNDSETFMRIFFSGDDADNNGMIELHEVASFSGEASFSQDGGANWWVKSTTLSAFRYLLDGIFGDDATEEVSFGNTEAFACGLLSPSDDEGTFEYFGGASLSGDSFTISSYAYSRSASGMCSDFRQASIGPIGQLVLSPVPLPTTLPLLAAGLGLFGWLGYRRRPAAQATPSRSRRAS